MKSTKLVLLFWVMCLSLQAQSVRDVFSSPSLIWYGIDFSKAKFVGPQETWGENQKLKETYFPAWNNFVLSEPDKYNLKKTYKKDIVNIDLKPVKVQNDKVATDNLIVTYGDVPMLSEASIVSHISNYADPSQKSLGLVFVVESFNKIKQKGLFHVVFFDVATGKVFMIKTMEGDAGGFGLKNYWAKSIFNVLLQCEKSWGKWKKEAGVK